MDFDTFRKVLLEGLGQANLYAGMNLLEYLKTPASSRTGDEAALLDDKLTPILLQALGYTRSDWIYNLQDKNIRPDFRVQLGKDEYPRPPFIVENKNTLEFLEPHLGQLEKYMRAYGTPLGILNNGRLLRAYERAGADLRLVAEINIQAWLESETGAQAELLENFDIALRAFHGRFNRDIFVGTQRLLDELRFTRSGQPHDESSWPAEARFTVRTHTDEYFERDLIDQTRELIRDITYDVSAQLELRLGEFASYQGELAKLEERFDSLLKDLHGELKKAKMGEATLQRVQLWAESRLEIHKPGNLTGDCTTFLLKELNLKQVIPSEKASQDEEEGLLEGGKKTRKAPKKVVLLIKLPESITEDLRYLDSFLMDYHTQRETLERRNAPALEVGAAFMSWQNRVATLVFPDQDLSRLKREFSSQTAYVLVVRMLLVRIIEDKGLIPRVFTNGGLSLWFGEVEERYLKYAQGKSTDFLLEMAYSSAQHIYAAFYSDLRLFDWYTPDRNLVVRVLYRLAGFNLSIIESDLIGHMYARYVEDEHKHETGMYYTPPEIVEYILDGVGFSGPDVLWKTILDPACGSGTFLVSAARRIVAAYRSYYDAQPGGMKPSNVADIVRAVQECVHGLDLNPFACYLAETNLLIQVLDLIKIALEAGEDLQIDRFNIHNTDTLSYEAQTRAYLNAPLGSMVDPSSLPMAEQIKAKIGTYEGGFDVVVANPPYVRADENEQIPIYRERIKREHPIEMVQKTMIKKWDLYIPFIALGVHLLKDGGRLGIITSNSIEVVPYAQALRTLLGQQTLNEISFFKGVKLFADAAVSNTVFTLQKAPPDSSCEVERVWHSAKPSPSTPTTRERQNQLERGEQIFRQEQAQANFSGVIRLGDICYVSKSMVLHSEEGLFKKDDLISLTKDEKHPKLYIEGGDIDNYYLSSLRFLEYGETLRAPSLVSRKTFPELHNRRKILHGETSSALVDEGQYGDYIYSNHSVLIMVKWSNLLGVASKSIDNAVGENRKLLEEVSLKFDQFFLAGVVNSTRGKQLLKSLSGSARLGRFHPEEFKNLPIPNISEKTQFGVARKVRELQSIGLEFFHLTRAGWKLNLERGEALAPALLPMPGVRTLELGKAKIAWGLSTTDHLASLSGLRVHGGALYKGKKLRFNVITGTPSQALEWLRRQWDRLPENTGFEKAEQERLMIPANPAEAEKALLELGLKESEVVLKIERFRTLRLEVDALVEALYASLELAPVEENSS